MKRNILYLILLLFASCQEELLNVESERTANYTNFWKNEQEVESAVNGLHASFRSTFGDWVVQARDRGVLFDYPGSIWTDAVENNLSYAYARDCRELSWSYEYKTSSIASFIIENIHRADLSPERENTWKGQAYFARAFANLYITQTWGDAPLVKESQDVSEQGCVNGEELLNFAISDAEQAFQILPPANELKDSKGNLLLSKQYFSKGSAAALLTHCYGWKAGFYQKPEYYKEVIKYATEVINDGNYQLADNPEDVCTVVLKGNSPEGIIELDYITNKNEYKDVGSYMAGACQRYPVESGTTPKTKRPVRLFNTTVLAMYPDESDLRRDAYFYKLLDMLNVTGNQSSAYIQKWRFSDDWTEGPFVGEIKTYLQNEIICRLPDIYLRRAEAYAKIGENDKAITDLNVIRRRAKAKEYTSTEGDLLAAIQLERDRELLLEGICIHFLDVLRNRNFKALKGKFQDLTEQDVKDGAVFLPVSLNAFQRNPAMKQKPYWKKNGFN